MIYCLGEDEPFRLTKNSGYNLMKAICVTEAKIIHASVDMGCPFLYVCIRIELPQDKRDMFEELLGRNLDEIEMIKGAATTHG